MNNVTNVFTPAERIVALMSQPTYDVHGTFISPTKTYSPSALKKVTRLPIAEVRKTLENLCEQGVVHPNGIVLPLFGHKREVTYTITTQKETDN